FFQFLFISLFYFFFFFFSSRRRHTRWPRDWSSDVCSSDLPFYSFYVLEDQKGLIGGLYVSSKFPQDSIAPRLLEELLVSMRAIPHLARIEAQLMPFSGPVDTPLIGQGFHLYTRQFMLLDLHKSHDA